MSNLDDWFIEQTGLNAEADGLSRTAGRLFGALLLSAAPRSLDDLVAALGVSKAGVSTEARRLRERGVLERVAVPGDRRDYYRVVPHFFVRLVRARVARWEALRALAVQMRDAGPPRPAAVRARLAEIEAVHDVVVARVEAALREWQAADGDLAQPGEGAGRGVASTAPRPSRARRAAS